MTDNEIIANLTRENQELKKENAELFNAMQNIVCACVCIGGPLNDNILNFDTKQQKWIWEIYNIANSFEKESE